MLDHVERADKDKKNSPPLGYIKGIQLSQHVVKLTIIAHVFKAVQTFVKLYFYKDARCFPV